MKKVKAKRKMKISFLAQGILLCVCFAVLFSFSGCSIFGDKDFLVLYDIESDPINLDPQTASDKASLTVINNVFEGLYSISQTGEAVPAVAKIVSQSGNVYTFTLREDAFWENGENVTARDFEFGIKRLIIAETNSPNASQLFCIKNAEAVNRGEMASSVLGVKALSDFALEITLNEKNDKIFYLLATTYTMPCNEKFFNESKGKYGLDENKVLSNGPFVLTSWKHEASIKLKRSESYYGSADMLVGGANLYIKPANETVERLKNKTIDAASIPREAIESFEKKGYNIQPIENSTWGILFNCKKDVTGNEKIRQGIAKCFDQSSYKEKLSGEFTVATALIPHGIFIYDKRYRETVKNENISFPYNPKEGAELVKAGLAELEMSKLEPLTIIVDKNKIPQAALLFSYPSQVLQREISLFINIEELETSEYESRLNSGDYDLAFFDAYSNDYSALSLLSKFLSTSAENKSGFASEAFDTAVATANAKSNSLTAAKEYLNAEQILINSGVFMPMLYSTDYFVESPKISNIHYNEQNGLVSFKTAKKS